MKNVSRIPLIVLVSSLLAASQARATQLATYDMDSNTGTAVSDISGAATALPATLQADSSLVVDATRPGALPGNLVLASGANGLGAFTNPGADDHSKLNTTGSFTIAAWLKTTVNADFRQIFGRGFEGERLYSFQQGSNSIGWAISNGRDFLNDPTGFQFNATGPDNGDDGEWHHYALSYDQVAQTITWFFDGAIAGSQATPIVSRAAIGQGIGIMGRQPDSQDPLPNSFVDDAVWWSEAANPDLMAAVGRGALNAPDIADISVPEPATGALLILACLSIELRQRFRL